jgi:hypothetical protein
MPRMSVPELEDIVRKGVQRLDMEIDSEALSQISFLSRGFPFYTHKLSAYAATTAINADQRRITLGHVDDAVKQTVNDGQYTHLKAYVTATASPRRDHLFREVLLACALADTDELGYFAASDVREPLTNIMGKPHEVPSFAKHLKDFCEPKRCILEKLGDKYATRFRFENPMMQPFVVMKGFADGMLKT